MTEALRARAREPGALVEGLEQKVEERTAAL